MSRSAQRGSQFFGVVSALLLGVILSSLRASPPRPLEEEPGSARLGLGPAQAVPGDICFMALSWAPGDTGTERIVETITFFSSELSFEEVRPTSKAESVKATILPRVTVHETDPQKSVLELTINASGNQPLPEGTLANLTFRLSKEAPIGMLQLENQARGFSVGELELQEIIAIDGEIESLDIPAIFACFFYMH